MNESLANQIFSLFVVREDVYAEGFFNRKTNKKVFKTIKEPLTLEIVSKHLTGELNIGTYNLNQDSMVKWGCLDFDKNTQEDFENAKKVYEFLKEKGFHPLFEKSGGGDYKVHIWIFSKELIPAKQMILFLTQITKEAGVEPHEIFPKQERINQGEFGNLVKLPLGLHPSTKKKSELLFTDLKFHLENLDSIPKLSELNEVPLTEFNSENKPEPSNFKPLLHKWDSFFSQTLKQSLPAGITKEVKIGTKEAGINNNLLKNQARWFYEKGYTEEVLKQEIKPLFDSNCWAFNDLLGWFHKAERGQLLEINERELREWIKNYYPSLEFYLPNKNERRNAESEEIPVYNFQSFLKLKPDKSFIVQDFLKPDSVTMVYSPPANFKTILMQNLAISIANGKEWLGLKTKKTPVLYLDGENANQRIKETLIGFYNGMKLKRKNFPFYVIKSGLMMDAKKQINEGFKIFLEKIIEEKRIKVLFFDTLHRFAYYDENKSDDTNKIYTEIFKPLKEKYGIAIIFLHHSTKGSGKNNGIYRGSGDFLGMVDVCYRLNRDKNTNKFTITNEKNRSGEISEICGDIIFEENFIKIERIREEEQEKDKKEEKTKFVALCEQIETFFDKDTELKRKDIIDYLDAVKYEYSNATLGRALKWLVDKKETLLKTEKGKYILNSSKWKGEF